jgi:hypothetical protein
VSSGGAALAAEPWQAEQEMAPDAPWHSAQVLVVTRAGPSAAWQRWQEAPSRRAASPWKSRLAVASQPAG